MNIFEPLAKKVMKKLDQEEVQDALARHRQTGMNKLTSLASPPVPAIKLSAMAVLIRRARK